MDFDNEGTYVTDGVIVKAASSIPLLNSSGYDNVALFGLVSSKSNRSITTAVRKYLKEQV